MSELQSATLKPHYHDHRKRLKKRFRQNGLDAFQDYESLELILTYAIAQKDVKPLAKDLLERFKTFQEVLDAPVDELTRIAGIGEHAALLIKIIRQSCDYYLNETILQKDIISSPAELLRYCRASMAALPNEQFRVIHLNAKNEIIHHEVIQEGTIDQTAVYPRKIMEHALKHKAVALIFVHNHPSGSPDPSAHDKRLTRTLVSTAEPLGITVHDHIIIAKNGYFSFNESGLL